MDKMFEFFSRHWDLSFAFFGVLAAIIVLELRSRLTGPRHISAQEVVILMNRDDALIVDLRDTAEFTKGHIIGAVNVEKAQLVAEVTRSQKKKSRPVVLVNKLGVQLSDSAKLLSGQSVKVHCLKGGMEAWRAAGMPSTT